MEQLKLTFDEKWEIILACDRAYDDVFLTAVKTTKIYCRPSCRSRKPKKENVLFYVDKKEVEAAGYRACKRCQPDLNQTPQLSVVQSVKTFLIDSYKQKIVLDDIAKHVGMSAFYLDRLFKQHTSVTPRSYLEKIRVDKAAHLIQTTSLSNLEICYEVGFQSPSHFYQAFRKGKMCSPGEYRKKAK